MAISMNPLFFLFLILLVSSFGLHSFADSDSDRVEELLHLQSQSEAGVIRLDDSTLRRFLTPQPRSYSFIIFFDAVQLRDKPDLHLTELRSEFELVASSFIANNRDLPSASKVFFCDIEFKESQSSFSLFGVSTLPHVRHVGPSVRNLKDSEPMQQSDFGRLADSMSEFVESKTQVSVGPIIRPPFVSKKQIVFLVACFVISTPFLIKKVLAGDTLLHDRKVWMAGAIFVYFFSVAGAMYNIIRKMPMFLADRNDPSKLIFFYQGSGMQLGAEGFAVGFLYTVVGLLLGFVTHVLVRVRNQTLQRGFMLFTILVSFWAVRKVVYLDNWKTGYGVHAFWPSNWA
ncbi:probable dolichyl-diphosphooligosaccharide--protein glycosyltransferase subunit 3B [Aristolochia californica]|uniref:probable dolichyl-diphosphooligosaccharide--protein glycosyltransferase subunit 3B n=1 Tax=Aristolochia californica TaxID=171875 RepID=UPI0035DACA1D